MWKRGEIAPKEQFLLFSTIFSVYLYFQDSNYIFICEMWLFDLSFFLNSANLICRDTDISKYFRESLGLQDNESPLYVIGKHIPNFLPIYVYEVLLMCTHNMFLWRKYYVDTPLWSGADPRFVYFPVKVFKVDIH